AAGARGGTLVAALSGEPDQLDPHKTSAYPSFQVLENVFDTLVQPGKDLEFEPALAERWETSEDDLTWTFTLRQGVKWHNGRDLTADDVVYSYNRIIKEKLANAFRFQAVKSVAARDPRTVVITLTRPSPNLLASIGAFKGMAIVAKENVADGSITRKPIGTGAFTFGSYAPGDSLRLARNDRWWGGQVALDGVEFRFVEEPTVALTNLQGGQVHWTDNLPPQQVEGLAEGDEPVVERTPSNDYWYFAANQARKPFDDVRVRQALAYGIDREAITEAAKFGLATVNQTAIPEGSAYHSDYAPYTRDVERAKSLLREAGVTGRLPLDLMVTNEYPETVSAAQVMASQLKEVGVDVKIRTLDFAAWLDQQGKGNFDVFLLGWLGNIDPDDYYYAQHHTGANFNFQKFSDPEVDRLLDEARRTVDEEQRKRLYDDAVKRIVDAGSYVYLYNPDVVQGWSPDVQGYEVRADRAVRFAGVSLAQ
ncbi:MAG: ABC transporter substrate-binding protein, partial [Actinomycetota bacterium]|nr:ABC transporter substrate-binding protein [Actinomycetota bacterium]